MQSEANLTYFFVQVASKKLYNWFIPLLKGNYFDPKTHPKSIKDIDNQGAIYPYWHVLYLLFQLIEDKEYISEIKGIIDSVCTYQDSDGERISNPNTDFAIISLITKLPPQEIENKHIIFFRTILYNNNRSSYGDIFEKLIDVLIDVRDKEKLLQCVDILFDYTIQKKEFGSDDIYFKLDIYDVTRIIDEKSAKIAEVCGIEVIGVVLNILCELQKEFPFFGHMISAIETHHQNNFSTDNYEYQLSKFLRESLLILPDTKELRYIVDEFLNSDKILQYRIGYYIINKRYLELKDVFWAIKVDNPLERYKHHEIYELIKDNCNKFSEAQMSIILSWIDNLDDNFEWAGEIRPSQAKKEWLSALLNRNEKRITERYDTELTKYPHTIEHPGFGSWMESYWGYVSPITIEDISDKSLVEIIDMFKQFLTSPKEEYKFRSPSEEGFLSIVKDDIKLSVDKYTINISAIKSAPIQFQFAWLSGLREYIYSNKKIFEDEETFKIIRDIFNNTSNIPEWGEDNIKGLATSIIKLIQEGTSYSEYNFSPICFPIIKEILLKIYSKKLYEDTITSNSDLLNTLYNSTNGSYYLTLISYSVLVGKGSMTKRWDKGIKQIIENMLQAEDNPVFQYALGHSIDQLHWLDNTWIFDNFDNIAPKNNLNKWKPFIHAYFQRGHFYLPMSIILEEKGYNELIVNNIEKIEKSSYIKVLSHLFISYHENILTLDSIPLKKILNSNNQEVYEQIIQYYFVISKKTPHSEKKKDLWRYLWNIHKGGRKKVSQYFLGQCYRWIGCFSVLDPELFTWIRGSLKNISTNNYGVFVSSISKYYEESPQQVAEIVTELVESTSKRYYINTIADLVERLYQQPNLVQYANRIYESYARRNDLTLRSLYEKNNE